MDVDKLAIYYAGFFDGEGYVFEAAYKDRVMVNPVHALTATVTQVDRRVLDRLQEILGCGNVYEKYDRRSVAKNWQICHQITLSDRSARQFLVWIEPYLFVKKEKVTEILNRHGREIIAKKPSRLPKEEK